MVLVYAYDYRAVLSEWARWEDTVRSSVEFIRVHGFFQDCDVELAAHLGARPTAMRHARVEAELITFARQESASARPGERLVGSSEVEESVFGKLKALEGDQCSSGFTRYVLSLGAVVGDWTTTRIKEALEITVVADASVGSDAGSIRHEGTLIGAPVLSVKRFRAGMKITV